MLQFKIGWGHTMLHSCRASEHLIFLYFFSAMTGECQQLSVGQWQDSPRHCQSYAGRCLYLQHAGDRNVHSTAVESCLAVGPLMHF